MNEQPRFLSARFSLKRALVMVAVVEAVIVAALFIYWTNFRDEFFPHPVNANCEPQARRTASRNRCWPYSRSWTSLSYKSAKRVRIGEAM